MYYNTLIVHKSGVLWHGLEKWKQGDYHNNNNNNTRAQCRKQTWYACIKVQC